MNRKLLSLLAVIVLSASCASYNSFERGRTAEKAKDWDQAVLEYQKAMEVDPQNLRYKVYLQRAKLEASRVHFEKGKSLRLAASTARGTADELRLAQMAAGELEIVIRLDPTNQFAMDELTKVVGTINEVQQVTSGKSIDEIKKDAAKKNITKVQPPQLNPASDQPISLSFPHETPIKEIYKALGNAFGINVLFDVGIKDSDRLSIELKDVTAQDALERVMQAANDFYKVLDEHTIIIVPDNPQARRDYEDLVIRTFYLSNGDAEQVTNVVRTMIEARNVFPLKALNAITIRDTADKVRIAEKIIEANDKAKSEVVVDVELLQLDIDKVRNFGISASLGGGTLAPQVTTTSTTGATTTPVSSATLSTLGTFTHIGNYSFTMPTATYAALKTFNNIELLANPELRISEGEKATLHIGQRIPVPVTTFTTGVTGGANGQFGSLPATSYQYQDVGIKVAIEPRVHHNREVTLKLTVEVSNQGANAPGTGGNGVPAQPTFITRTIESTIRLKDGETNFLAGLIQQNDAQSDTKTPFLGDLPIIGRLFTQSNKELTRTDLVLTMTPHIIRMPDITEDDVAPMWVGTQNNLTFRGLSPRLESRTNVDPFTNPPRAGQRDPQTGLVWADGEPGNYINAPTTTPGGRGSQPATTTPPQGGAPSDPFRTPQPPPPRPPVPQSQGEGAALNNNVQMSIDPAAEPHAVAAAMVAQPSPSNSGISSSGLSPRVGPQPMHLSVKPGEEKLWEIMGMDLDGLTASQIVLHFDPHTIDISQVGFGSALQVDIAAPPHVMIDRNKGTIVISSADGGLLHFNSGGDIAALRLRGVLNGETYLVLDNLDLKDGNGALVAATIGGGRARVE